MWSAAPPSASPEGWSPKRSSLAGISDGDAKLLKGAFNITTVGDLGRNPYFRTASALVALTGGTE
ncbi:hypothetical protein [Micromonospora ureilytica]|uniref:hypothetical protein n=1 Tax=Micromonospora ureilytica TaxID=709868 RepID=UPI002E14E820|nr:hypothetical protein OHB55_31830 [Micromonospora ureilytica]